MIELERFTICMDSTQSGSGAGPLEDPLYHITICDVEYTRKIHKAAQQHTKGLVKAGRMKV